MPEPCKRVRSRFCQSSSNGMTCLCRHENVSGYYRVSAYFFSKLFCDLLPYRTFPVIIFGTITYWMMGQCLITPFTPPPPACYLLYSALLFSGLAAYWQNYLVFLISIITTSWSATFVAFAASATAKEQAMASLIVALVYVVQMVSHRFSTVLPVLNSLVGIVRITMIKPNTTI